MSRHPNTFTIYFLKKRKAQATYLKNMFKNSILAMEMAKSRYGRMPSEEEEWKPTNEQQREQSNGIKYPQKRYDSNDYVWSRYMGNVNRPTKDLTL